MQFKLREGDFIETLDGLIFDVKGLVHPPNRIVAYPRYFPQEEGERKQGGKRYCKVYSLSSRYALVKRRHPQFMIHDPIFDAEICEVPIETVKKQYRPHERLMELLTSDSLDELEKMAVQLAKALKKNANIPWKAIGISGSIMAGLHTSSSDIDPIIYGAVNCRRVYSTLKSMLKENNGLFKSYDSEDLRKLFGFRSKDTEMNYEDFVQIESRKVLQGKFLHRDYFIRFVKDWSEVKEKYGGTRYMNVGYARVRALVVDDSASIFTPCVYKIGEVQILEGPKAEPIEEVVSFRGRFCEQAHTDETVIAQGKIEHVKDRMLDREYYRLLLGNKPSDYMLLA